MSIKVTINDVCKEAGVSKTAVSAVLNGVDGYSDETVKKVKAAIKKLNYQPRKNRLRSENTKTKFKEKICLFFPDSNEDSIQTPLSKKFISGVKYRLNKEGFELLVKVSGPKQEIPQCIRKKEVDAIIFRGTPDHDTFELMGNTPKIQAFANDELGRGVDLVQPDNPGMGYLAAKYMDKHEVDYFLSCSVLDRKNHREHSSFIQRINPFLKFNPNSEILLAQSEELAEKILNFIKSKVGKAGVFIPGHDSDVINIFKKLQSAGLVIDRDYHLICCFSDPEIIRKIDPRIAVISLKARQVGVEAADLALWRINNKNTSPTLRYVDVSIEKSNS